MRDSGARPEFSRAVPLTQVRDTPRACPLRATPAECDALAKRFGLERMAHLEATVDLWRTPAGVRLQGHLRADVVQACVVSGAPVASHVDVPVDLVFSAASAGEEIEVDDGPDRVDLNGDTVDLGEAVAETLFLALDPYPRADPATLAAARRRLVSEEDAEERAATSVTPFAVLRGERGA